MISQFFEVQVKEGQANRYLDLAASLKPSFEAMGGCLFIDRFKSLTRKNRLLSYQIWQDEGSMIASRVDANHHTVQETGREKVFDDYRIRISQVIHEERPAQAAWRPERPRNPGAGSCRWIRPGSATPSRACTGPALSRTLSTCRCLIPASTAGASFLPIRRLNIFAYSR